MGILNKKIEDVQTTLNDVKRVVRGKVSKKKKHSGGSKSGSPEVLELEAERFSQYIDPRFKDRIIDLKSGLKYGVEKVGSFRDIHGVLGLDEGQLFYGATKKTRLAAAKKFVKLFAKKNFNEKIITKSGDVAGKMISKNVYLKQVSYDRAGKTISFIQARNVRTGRIVSLKIAKMLIGRQLARGV